MKVEIDKVLVFDVWGDYAHFRRGYTTTSPTTFPFPSRTTLSGLVAAILGLPNEKNDHENSYYQFFRKENSTFALRILNPIKKEMMNQNLMNTKHGFAPWEISPNPPRTQISFEFIKNPKYRVYIGLSNNKLYLDLKEKLKNHLSVYTPCLGITECIANFEFRGEFVDGITLKKDTADKSIEINSIIKQDDKIKIKVEPKKYGTSRVPMVMNTNREVEDYATFIYEIDGNPLTIESGTFYKCGSENISENVVFF